MYMLCDEIFMHQNGGTLIRSAGMTLMTLFSYVGLLPCLMGPQTIKSNDNPANGRGPVNVPVVLKHINKVFPRP